MAMVEYMNAVLDERRVERQDDIVSHLLDIEIDGRPLDDAELQQICTLLYAAGLDTVAGELGYMFLHLANHPEHRRLIIEQPERIPSFVEETLRVYSIVTTNRIVTRDVEFAGCPMEAGDRVLCRFPRPTETHSNSPMPTRSRRPRRQSTHRLRRGAAPMPRFAPRGPRTSDRVGGMAPPHSRLRRRQWSRGHVPRRWCRRRGQPSARVAR